MSTVAVKIDGLAELQRRLAAISESMAKTDVRAAVSAGARVIAAEAKTRAPVYVVDQDHRIGKNHPPPGTLKRAILTGYDRKASREYYLQTATVYVRKGKKYRAQGRKGNLSQDAFYAHMVERGTAKMAARPFMRPAFEAKKMDAIEAMKARLKERLDKR